VPISAMFSGRSNLPNAVAKAQVVLGAKNLIM
jgi:hypothetical protein